MAHRISIASIANQAKAHSIRSTLTSRFPDARLSDVTVSVSYTVDGALSDDDLKKAVAVLTNPVIDTTSTTKVLAPTRSGEET